MVELLLGGFGRAVEVVRGCEELLVDVREELLSGGRGEEGFAAVEDGLALAVGEVELGGADGLEEGENVAKGMAANCAGSIGIETPSIVMGWGVLFTTVSVRLVTVNRGFVI